MQQSAQRQPLLPHWTQQPLSVAAACAAVCATAAAAATPHLSAPWAGARPPGRCCWGVEHELGPVWVHCKSCSHTPAQQPGCSLRPYLCPPCPATPCGPEGGAAQEQLRQAVRALAVLREGWGHGEGIETLAVGLGSGGQCATCWGVLAGWRAAEGVAQLACASFCLSKAGCCKATLSRLSRNGVGSAAPFLHGTALHECCLLLQFCCYSTPQLWSSEDGKLGRVASTVLRACKRASRAPGLQPRRCDSVS